MPFTAQEVVTRCREDVSDEKPDYRWDDTRLFRYITDGRNEIVRQRPDAQYTDTDIVTTPVDSLPAITKLTDVVAISRVYLNALVHYVDYRILSGDSENAGEDKVAAGHFEQFVAEIR